MNSEPPSEITPMQDEGLAAESHEPSENERPVRWRSITAVVGVLAVAGGIAAFLFLSSDSDPPAKPSGPATGLACPHLRQAADAYEQEDRVAFDEAITRAAQVAEQTLETSGQVFGEPERIALELSLRTDPPRADIVSLLTAAQAACSEEPANS